MVFLLLYIFPLINRIYGWATNKDEFILYFLQVLTAPLLGFCNALIYGLNPEFKKQLFNFFIAHGCMKGEIKKTDTINETTLGGNTTNRDTQIPGNDESDVESSTQLPPPTIPTRPNLPTN